MYMDLYLMIRNENETIKENKQKFNKKDLLRDEFIKFQWPWIL